MAKKDNIEGSNESDTCNRKVEVPSEEELVALNAMRAIKARVRDLKRRISEISRLDKDELNEEVLKLEEEMGELKAEWNEWEEKRKKAASERMVLLGHEKVD
ncbi:MAG: hypothetical protein JSW15_09295 [Deltaproteobacteria bacterium]|nr:MAG: hypothetical protein JSW15_09295 [Deltaproteobacteria bacterium]